jgi:shikimate dehydrogenase
LIVNTINSLITNSIDESCLSEPFSVMIGAKPSLGARSPILWNAILAHKSKMICLDINSQDRLAMLFKILESNPLCLGGAVTSPYKEDFLHMCSRSTSMASDTGSCNNFYRDSSGYFLADNTDGHGFFRSLAENVDLSTIRHILILGSGGASKSAKSVLLQHLQSNQRLYVLSRSGRNIACYDPEKSCDPIAYNSFAFYSSALSFDNVLVVNCTSVGDYVAPDGSLLNEVPQIAQIIGSMTVNFVFDCIHTPALSSFRSLFPERSVNGKDMNLYQAVAGFTNVYPQFDVNYVEQQMRASS